MRYSWGSGSATISVWRLTQTCTDHAGWREFYVFYFRRIPVCVQFSRRCRCPVPSPAGLPSLQIERHVSCEFGKYETRTRSRWIVLVQVRASRRIFSVSHLPGAHRCSRSSCRSCRDSSPTCGRFARFAYRGAKPDHILKRDGKGRNGPRVISSEELVAPSRQLRTRRTYAMDMQAEP